MRMMEVSGIQNSLLCGERQIAHPPRGGSGKWRKMGITNRRERKVKNLQRPTRHCQTGSFSSKSSFRGNTSRRPSTILPMETLPGNLHKNRVSMSSLNLSSSQHQSLFNNGGGIPPQISRYQQCHPDIPEMVQKRR